MAEALFIRSHVKTQRRNSLRRLRVKNHWAGTALFGKGDYLDFFHPLQNLLSHTVPGLNKKLRLPDYLIGIFEACPTKAAIKKAIKKGLIMVDSRPGETATWIKGGEEITLRLEEPVPPKKKLVFPLKVLFEDEQLAIIHKPAGILVSGNGFVNIVNALPQNLQKSTAVDACAPRPVHRLDYPTTGLLLIGKTSSAVRDLSRQFQQSSIQKTYYAIAIGSMEPKGELSYPIDHKSAQTDFEVLGTVPSERFGHLNLVKLKPKTGRRHQIRKHLAQNGNPILGDKDYRKEGMVLKGKGLYLHAQALVFTHPVTLKKMNFQGELPQKFSKIFPERASLQKA